MRTGLRLFGLLCAVAGLAAAGYGFLRYQTEVRFLAGAGHVIGRVVEIQTTPVDEQDNRYCPIVEFTPPKGKTLSFVDTVCGSPSPHRKGDNVPVLYETADPDQARIDAGTTAASQLAQPATWTLIAWIVAGLALWGSGRVRA
ncbi:MAG TPA: DUF3592 domain-containing protein [Myxococcales bacterium]|nr:DUF3592 domain-containing protein [Myxococcales bacterium]